ncbi:MAG: ABC-2 transporter permease [Candidatus Pacebacteria bacterium]|nr:ABC-2 transporter permease [Candidatus Paceibacterota bacterium]
MNNIFNSIKLDYYILKSIDFTRIAVVALIALFVGFIVKNPPIILGILMMTSGFFVATMFAIIEKNNLDRLYGILPVKKQQTVIGRYLLTFFTGIVIAAFAAILAFIVYFILKIQFSGFLFAAWVSGSFLFFCLLVAVQFPLYFKYDFSKLVAFANLPYIFLIIGGAFLIKRYPELFAQIIKFFVQNSYMVWVVGILGSMLLLSISTWIAIALYKNRES